MITAREYNMLKTFSPTRWWRYLPVTAEKMLDEKLIEPTEFGWGNYRKTAKGREAVAEYEVKNHGE